MALALLENPERIHVARALHEEAATRFKIDYIEVPALAISSTDLRRRVAERRPIRYLTPESVAAYIEKHSLYREAAL